jgi:hypothetical protein
VEGIEELQEWFPFDLVISDSEYAEVSPDFSCSVASFGV